VGVRSGEKPQSLQGNANDFNMLRNSRRTKKVTHPEASGSNKAKAGVKQLCCLLNLTACQTLTAKVRSNLSQLRVPSSECVVNFISGSVEFAVDL